MLESNIKALQCNSVQYGRSKKGRAMMCAVGDMARYTNRLASIVHNVPVGKHGIALTWISDWRMYCFEQNFDRWPNGKFYLLDRSYECWRGHRIAFTRAELTTLGFDEWDRLAIRCGHDDDWVPLEADCFHENPRRQLARYVCRIAGLFEAFTARWPSTKSGIFDGAGNPMPSPPGAEIFDSEGNRVANP
jgi:hypothetical protein